MQGIAAGGFAMYRRVSASKTHETGPSTSNHIISHRIRNIRPASGISRLTCHSWQRPSRRQLITLASAAAERTGTASSSTSTVSTDPLSAAASRHSRLQVLIQIRKLYRNLLRAEPILELPAPVYQPLTIDPPATASQGGEEEELDAAALQDEEQRRIDEAVEIVAEMELAAEELRAGARALKASTLPFGTVLKPNDPDAAEAAVEEKVKDIYNALVDRAKTELAFLPFPTRAAAQAAVDARNARYRNSVAWLPVDGYVSDDQAIAAGEQRRGLSERLNQAERVAEQFVARKLQPAVKKVRETSAEGVLEGLKISATYAKDVWSRLNGASPDGRSGASPRGLPLPQGSESDRNKELDRLHDEIENLEKKLQEASKARETRLRKAGIQGRARMASELREMDNEVAALSRALAVRTLQLEAEYAFSALEAEALDTLGDSGAGGDRSIALGRRGSSDEIALLAAEFKLLDDQLASLVAEVEAGDALYIDDVELAKLATDIPDMRMRLGIGDTAVFGGTGMSLTKLQMQLKQSISKIGEGVNFGVRGVRLLFNDVGNAGSLFWRALIGGTLKPREVQALRRTARDILTFIPFTIILILPLSPVGHVLIFGFIQRYFPGFFPSQFTNRRQELMIKYEELKGQLQDAQVQAEVENDELEFQRAAAAAQLAIEQRKAQQAQQAVLQISNEIDNAQAALDAASHNSGGGSGGDSSSSLVSTDAPEPLDGPQGPAARAVKELEEQLAAAADSSYTGDVEDSGEAEHGV